MNGESQIETEKFIIQFLEDGNIKIIKITRNELLKIVPQSNNSIIVE